MHSYDIVFGEDGADTFPRVTIASESSAWVFGWAERQAGPQKFEVREDGRKLAKVRYSPNKIWIISS